ncbi:MAG: hypothetical protein IJM18_07100 [Clostridia bacterium]|nr:hypothetical protein [Clostridia bacterium]
MAIIHGSLEEEQRRKKRNRIYSWVFGGIALAVLLTLCVLSIVAASSKTVSIYQNAEALIAAGEYDEAKTLLETIRRKGYHDTEAFIKLCQAHIEYERGREIDAYHAYYTMKEVRFRYISQAQRSEIDAFRKVLQDEYKAYIKKEADRAQAEYERKQNLPFPSVGQHVTQAQLNGMTWRGLDSQTFDEQTTIYLYIDNGNQYRLWITKYYCIKKVVKLSGTSSGSTPGKTGTSSFDNVPSVDGYSDPEEFYEWNWDNFYDFEDAESYYYEHGGK